MVRQENGRCKKLNLKPEKIRSHSLVIVGRRAAHFVASIRDLSPAHTDGVCRLLKEVRQQFVVSLFARVLR